MKYQINRGTTMTFTAPTGGVVSGTPVLIGGLLVIPEATVAQTLPFAGAAVGTFSLAKATGNAWTEGQTLYWDSANSNFVVAQSATARRMGSAAATALSGDTTGQVRLNNGSFPVNVA